MSTDPARVELTLHEDSRLMPAVGAIVSHAAGRAGLSDEAGEKFAAAAVEACRGTFPLLSNNSAHASALKLEVEDFPDRVEVTIEHAGEPLPAAGLDTFCGGGTKETSEAVSKSLQGSEVDRVQYESKDGRSRMKLIKYKKGECAAD